MSVKHNNSWAAARAAGTQDSSRTRKPPAHFGDAAICIFSSPFHLRFGSLAFLSDCYCTAACFKEGKWGENYFPRNDTPSDVTSMSPPGFCACSTNHAGNSLSSQDFGHCFIPVGCLEGSSISATSLQACTAHGPCKSLITHRLQILLESAQHSR